MCGTGMAEERRLASTADARSRGAEIEMGSGDGANLIGDEASPDPFVGHLIGGRYHVLSKLAAGQRGLVYLAQQISTGITVALKVLDDEYAKDGTFVERFRRVMLVLAAVSEQHPNIVRVFECDQAEDGRLFVAMEYLEGQLLSELIQKEGPLEIESTLSLAEQMAEGLNAVHSVGIIHADVRPENFMIVGETMGVKLIGFERAYMGGVGTMDSLIRSGADARPPEYLAPEQIEAREITRQTDIYAFGVVLYQMLSGVVPFRASTPEEVLAMHLHEAPAPLRDLRPEIPRALEGKVLQALAKEPHRREGYANHVINELLITLVVEELKVQAADKKKGVFARTRKALQTVLGGAGSIDATRSGEREVGWSLAPISRTREAPRGDMGGTRNLAAKIGRTGAGWKLAAAIGLLILVIVSAFWMAFSRKGSELPSVPPPRQVPDVVRLPAEAIAPRQNPDAAQGPGPAMVGQPEQKTEGIPVHSVPAITSPEAPPPSSGFQRADRPVGKKDALPARQKKTQPARPAQLQAAPRSPTPDTQPPRKEAESQGASPDPTEVIDWILNHR